MTGTTTDTHFPWQYWGKGTVYSSAKQGEVFKRYCSLCPFLLAPGLWCLPRLLVIHWLCSLAPKQPFPLSVWGAHYWLCPAKTCPAGMEIQRECPGIQTQSRVHSHHPWPFRFTLARTAPQLTLMLTGSTFPPETSGWLHSSAQIC